MSYPSAYERNIAKNGLRLLLVSILAILCFAGIVTVILYVGKHYLK